MGKGKKKLRRKILNLEVEIRQMKNNISVLIEPGDTEEKRRLIQYLHVKNNIYSELARFAWFGSVGITEQIIKDNPVTKDDVFKYQELEKEDFTRITGGVNPES